MKTFSKKRFWVLIILLLISMVILYYQFLNKSEEVKNEIVRSERIFTGHTSEIWSVKFSPDGQLLASAGVDSAVKIWQRESGKLIKELKHPMGVTYFNFSPDGNYIATSSYDSKVRLWNVQDGKILKEFSGHSNTVWHLAYSPDGTTLASSGEDSAIKLWNIESGSLIRTLKGHRLTIWSVKFSPDGSKLASGSFDASLKIWDVKTGELLKNITGHTEAIVDLAYSHDGKLIASTSDDKTIRLWNAETGQEVRKMMVPEHIQAVTFSPDDKRLMTGGRDKPMIGEFLQEIFGDSEINKGVSARLWDVQTGELLQTFSDHSNDVNDIAYSNDGVWIATAGSDKLVRLYKVVK